MLQNTIRDHLCFELRHQSRQATNTDAILVTEDGEEVTAHQAVLGLHSRLLRTLLMKNRSYEVPKLIICGVSKTVLKAFISLLYCGEVSLDRPGSENLTDLLRRLDVDTKHFSFSGFFIQSQSKAKSLKGNETKANNLEEVKTETDYISEEDEEDELRNDIFDDDCNEDQSDCTTVENFDENSVSKIHLESPDKVSVIPILKSGTDLRKVKYDPEFLKKKKEEEILQGIRWPNGKKKKKISRLKKKEQQKEKTGQFVCPDCGIVVLRKSTLKKHLQEIHQGVRYPCDQCPHQARNKTALKRHIESVHEGKRYYCDQCEYAAVSNGNLIKHIRETHCERNHMCDSCDFRAKTAETLKAHVNAIHLKIKLTCPECGSKHSQQGHLTKHRKLKHGYKTRDYATHKQKVKT